MNGPDEPLELIDSTMSDESTTVEVTGSWPTIVPAFALALIVIVGAIGLVRGGSSDEPLANATDATSANGVILPTTTPATTPATTLVQSGTDEPSPEPTVVTTAPVSRSKVAVDEVLATSVDVSQIPMKGAFYAIGSGQRLVRIDLSTGEVTRTSQSVGDPSSIDSLNDGVLLKGPTPLIVDDSLETITEFIGRSAVGNPVEVWTIEAGDDDKAQGRLFNNDPQVGDEIVVPAQLEWATGAYVDGEFQVYPGEVTWSSTIDEAGTVVAALAENLGFLSATSDVAQVCGDDNLACIRVVFRDGLEIALPDALSNASSLMLSPTGSFLLAQTPTGRSVVNLDDPDPAGWLRVLPGDSWSDGADLIVRTIGSELAILDPDSGERWRLELPADLARGPSASLLKIASG